MTKVLILGAGYGTRLQRDILASPDAGFSHLLGVPKALLPLGNRDALITHWLDDVALAGLSVSEDVYLVSNAKMYPKFLEWAKRHDIPPEHIANDGTETNETRLGAVADIEFAIKHFGLANADLVVVGGDTLFLKDFDFPRLIKIFGERKDCLVTTYEIDPSLMSKYGIAEFEESSSEPGLPRVVKFHEKPAPHIVNSNSAVPCFYMLKSAALPLISEFLEACRKREAALEEYDATGKVVGYICSRFNVRAAPVKGRIDVGGLQSYVDAQEYFRKVMEKPTEPAKDREEVSSDPNGKDGVLAESGVTPNLNTEDRSRSRKKDSRCRIM